MSVVRKQSVEERLRGALSWVRLIVPPLVWAIQFETVYVLEPTRTPGTVGSMRWISAAALLAAAGATASAYTELERLKRETRPSDRRGRPSLWLASAGVGLGLFFCLVIMTTALVTWFVAPED